MIMRAKTSMQLAAVGLLGLASVSLVWALTAPLSVEVPSPAKPLRIVQPVARETMESENGLNDRWTTLFAAHYQRPLYDPPPEAPKPVVKKVTPPPPIKVLATMGEPEGGHAMIEDDKGKVSIVAVGATVSAGGTQAKLLNVHKDGIELDHEGKVITISITQD